MKRKMKKQEQISTAYALPEGMSPPGLLEGQEWHAMRVSMSYFGKGKFRDGVPAEDRPNVFSIVVTDRKAAKEYMSRRIDELFDIEEKYWGKN